MKKTFFALLAAGSLTAVSLAAAQEGSIAQRRERQQDRIGQGVKSGELTPHEAENLERKEMRVNKEVRRERTANGGNLTNNEKRQINRQQNRISRDIYKDKHNGAEQK